MTTKNKDAAIAAIRDAVGLDETASAEEILFAVKTLLGDGAVIEARARALGLTRREAVMLGAKRIDPAKYIRTKNQIARRASR